MPVIPEFRRRGREDPEVRTVSVTQLGWGQTEPHEVSSKKYHSFYSVSCLGECFQSLQIWFTLGRWPRNAWHDPFTGGDFPCLTAHCINQFQYYTSLRIKSSQVTQTFELWPFKVLHNEFSPLMLFILSCDWNTNSLHVPYFWARPSRTGIADISYVGKSWKMCILKEDDSHTTPTSYWSEFSH